jgi:hypothetical protein
LNFISSRFLFHFPKTNSIIIPYAVVSKKASKQGKVDFPPFHFTDLRNVLVSPTLAQAPR